MGNRVDQFEDGPSSPPTRGGGAVAETSADLFRAALAGTPGSRPPVLFTGGAWVGRLSGLPRDRLLNDAGALVEAQRAAHGLVGQDVLFAYFDPLFVPEAYGCGLRFLETGPLVEPQPFERIAGRAPRVDDGRLPVVLEAISGLAEYGDGRIPVGTLIEGPFTTLARIVDAEVVLRLTIKEPQALEDALARVGDLLVDFVRAAAQAGADFVIVADPVASATMISGAMYRRFALPPQQRLFAEARVPVILHICGDTRPVLPLMAESGAAALSIDQCMDLRAARSSIGDTCALAGNVDPMTLLTGTPDQVTEETRAVAAAGGERRYLLMPGCGVPPQTPVENVVAMVAAVVSG